MSIEVKIPSVGESITSGVISVWHHKTGDSVQEGDTLLTLDTDKVSTDIAAEASGVLQIQAEEGREVKIGEVVAIISAGATASAPTPAVSPAPVVPATPAVPTPVPTAPVSSSFAPPAGLPVNPPTAPTAPSVPPPSVASDTISAPILSPAARRIAEEENVQPATVTPTGPGGRITKEDVVSFLETRRQQGNAAPAFSTETAPPVAPTPQPPASQVPVVSQEIAPALQDSGKAEAITTRKRLTPLRRKIAEQLVNAQQTAALLTTFNECDLTAVKSVRARMQDSFQKRHGIKLGFMSFFIKAVVNALQEVPAINGRLDGEDFVQNHFYDIGVAVGTDRGLVVPVIRQADRKSFGEVEKDLANYAVRAREGKITLDDLRGGVFTISNGGVYGSLLSTPIVNPPQSGILGMHKIQERPVAIDGKIEIRPMMYLALTYDHRVVDGKEAVTFLVKVKEGIEDPMSLLL